MALTPSTIHPARGSVTTSKRVGRGAGSGKGTTAARGQKGQRARSGGTRGIARRALKQMVQKIPKLRGFHSMYAKPQTVNLSSLQSVFSDGDVITPATLHKKGLIRRSDAKVKVLSKGDLTKKITIKGCLVSKVVLEKVEKVGGKVLF